MERFRIAVIGLGLIGGSMAYALRGFQNAEIIGCDIDAATREAAYKSRAVDAVYADAAQAISGADLVILCIYPDAIPKLVTEAAAAFKPGAVLTDVSGVKTRVAERIAACLPEGVDYVGGHPMAGKEVEGFANASPELFWMTGFIVCPLPSSRPENVKLILEMAHYIGATRIAVDTPQEHDSIIAYTSDLMHVAAAALCLDFHPGMNRAYTAGAFRDCTRIARINPELWCELFLENRTNTLYEIDRLEKSLSRLRQAIEEEDAPALHALLQQVQENKIEMNGREPAQG